jgi:hypothetical protein
LDDLTWRKSRHSSTEGGSCVELAPAGRQVVGIRDSRDPNGPKHWLQVNDLANLFADIREGKHDLKWRKSRHSSSEGGSCVELAPAGRQVVGIRDSRDPNGPKHWLQVNNLANLFTDIREGKHDLT